jgi:hypothetical protein
MKPAPELSACFFCFLSRLIFTLKMEAIYSSEVYAFLRTTGRYKPNDRTLHSYCSEDLIPTYLLFYDALSNSDFIAWNGKIISEKLNGKDVEGNDRGLI